VIVVFFAEAPASAARDCAYRSASKASLGRLLPLPVSAIFLNSMLQKPTGNSESRLHALR
jgi:hypothetical protein